MIFKTIHDIKVSSIVLGTDTFGTDTSEAESFALLDNFLELGGTTVDTARVYGCHYGGGDGISELTVGKWLASRKCRDRVVISTKCAHPPLDSMTTGRLSREEIESDIDASLRALGVDYIDILWLHRDDTSRSVEEIVDTLNLMVQKGKIRCFGGSNWKAERFAPANAYAQRMDKDGFAASQLKWSAAKSAPGFCDDPTLVEMDKTEYEYYAKAKMPVFAFASQAKGFFQKYARGGEDALSPKAKKRYLCPENLAMYEKLNALSREYGISLSAAVVSVLTSNTDFDTAAIVGCKTLEQLRDTMTGSDVVLPYDEIKQLLNV